MIGFGRTNPFPFRFGGGDSLIDTLHESLLDAYAPGWDISDEGDKTVEAYAQALAITMIWVANRRVAAQGQPLRMLEYLPVWEEATGLRPSAMDRPVDRRRRLAAKLRGLAGSTLSDIAEACRALLGRNFVRLLPTAARNEIVYWPGQNPGPPGYEWSTNRCTLRVQVSKAGLSNTEFYATMGELEQLLDALLPSWMTFTWFVGAGFTVGASALGEDGL